MLISCACLRKGKKRSTWKSVARAADWLNRFFYNAIYLRMFVLDSSVFFLLCFVQLKNNNIPLYISQLDNNSIYRFIKTRFMWETKYTKDSAQIALLTAYKSYNWQSIARSAEKKNTVIAQDLRSLGHVSNHVHVVSVRRGGKGGGR